MSRLVDLEFTRVEIGLRESGPGLKPSLVHADLEAATRVCRETQRLTPVALAVEIEAEGDLYFEQFASCCKLAKAIKVVAISVRAGELGTPFNAEIERLREMVRLATLDGARVCLQTEVGRMTQDPTTAAVLCEQVKGLAITLDPSHFVLGPHGAESYDPLLRYVGHVRLRDTSKTQLQVRVGQGEVEYGRLVTQLSKAKYNRALCVEIIEDPESGVEHFAEMRKLRLLLESLL